MTRRRGAVADLLIASAIALAGIVAVYRAADWPRDHYWWAARDVWFDADSDRVFFVEAIHTWGYDRVAIHPLHAYLTRPVVSVLRRAGLSDDAAVRHLHAAIGALWLSCFFLLLRRFRCRRFDSLILTAAAGSTAAAFFWLPAIETFALGSLSMFPALALAARADAAPAWRHGLAVVSGLSVTVTNAMAAVFGAIVALRRKKAAAAVLAAGGLVAALAAAHRTIYWGSALTSASGGSEWAWVFAPESGGAWAVARAFFFGSAVAPEIGFLPNWRHPMWPLMSFQSSELFSGSWWAVPATVAWAGLLGFGAWAILRSKEDARLRMVLGLSVLFQLLMHLIYGRETFLYSLHFVPLLLGAAALATRTRLRPWVLALVAAFIVCSVPNNAKRYAWARSYVARAEALKKAKPEVGLWSVESVVPADDSGAYRFWRRR